MGIETAIIGAGVLGATGAVAGSAISSNAASSAAKTQGNATIHATQLHIQAQKESEALQRKYLEETRADIAEAVRLGIMDLETGFNAAINEMQPLASMEELNQARSVLHDPSQIRKLPGYNFQYSQGLDSLNAAISKTTGGGISGPQLKAAQEYGQNFATQSLNSYLNTLMPFINIGVGAKRDIANLNISLAQGKGNLRMGGATGTANATIPMVNNIASGINQTGANVASGIMRGADITASNYINQANVANNLISSLTGNVNSMATLYALRPDLFASTAKPQDTSVLRI
jgi:hypothetical protein